MRGGASGAHPGRIDTDMNGTIKRGRIPLVGKIMAGFVLGTVCGLVLSEFCCKETVSKVVSFISPFGNVLIAMLKTVVYPIILFSLILGAASLPLKKSGRIGASVLLWYFLTSVFATVFGVVLARALDPSMSSARDVAKSFLGSVENMSTSSGGSFDSFVTGLFQNPFAALANGHFLPIIVFAIGFGLCARALLDSSSVSDSAKRSVGTLIECCDGAQKISFKLIDCVIHYFPIGVFALSAVNFAENGVLLFGPYAKITLCVVTGVLSMMFFVYPLALAVFCRENPYRILMRLREPMLTAFVTRSSAATLPVSFKAADALGVDRAVSSFSLPVGSTVNMDGVCVHLPVFVILAANMFGHDLGAMQIATLCVSIVFASIGAGGIPGGSVFLLFMVLENMGLPPSQVSLVVALCLGINPVLDMFETCCNVTGDNVCTYIVSKKFKSRSKAAKALLVVLSLVCIPVFQASAKDSVVSFYVSPKGRDDAPGTRKQPVRTPDQALSLARKVLSDARREIVFLDGYYELERPIRLGADDVDMTFRADKKGKAVLSGASRVTGWRREGESSDLVVAKMPFEADENALYLLVVNSRHASLSAYPKGKNISCPAVLGDGKNFHDLPYEASSFPEDFDISSLDISSVWLSIPQEWAVTRSFISVNDVKNSRFVLKSPTNMAIGMYNSGFKLINSRLGLIDPGSWMFEKSTSSIVYKLRPGETPENIVATITRLPSLFNLHRVEDCTIDSLVMEGCLELFSNAPYSTNCLSAVVSAKFTPRLKVRNCEIRDSRSGGIYMLKADRCVIEKNYIHDVSTTGICFIDGGAGNCKVNSNKLRNMYAGISMQIGRVECMWNDIAEIGRSALLLWSSFSVVASNRLGNCMLRSRDGGALYGSYDYCLIKDNFVKYTKKSIWPGLYADEGSQHNVFTGNRTDGLWWPTHMHQTYGISVSNNVFRSDSPMRWSFQGSMFGRFTDNRIYAPKTIKSDAYLPNCVEWARNKVYVKGEGGKYTFDKNLTLKRKKAVREPEIFVSVNSAAEEGSSLIDGKRKAGEYPAQQAGNTSVYTGEDGYLIAGTQPSHIFRCSCDERYLYVHVEYRFSKCTPYFGQMNFGDKYGVHDSIRLYFGEKKIFTLFWTGSALVEGVDFAFRNGDIKVDPGGWWTGSGLEARIPLSVLGIEKKEYGPSVAFNCESYNADHDLKRFLFPIGEKVVATGVLVFPLDVVKEVK